MSFCGLDDCMRTMSLRLPDSLHRKAREMAEQEGVSINRVVPRTS